MPIRNNFTAMYSYNKSHCIIHDLLMAYRIWKKENADVLLVRQMLSFATRAIYNWCPLCGYKVRKNRKPSRLHHNLCSNRSFVPFGWCRVCYQEHQLDPSIVALSEFCFKTPSEHLITSRQTLEGIQQPACDVSFPEGNNSFEDDDDIISTEDQEETIQFKSISGKT